MYKSLVRTLRITVVTTANYKIILLYIQHYNHIKCPSVILTPALGPSGSVRESCNGSRDASLHVLNDCPSLCAKPKTLYSAQ